MVKSDNDFEYEEVKERANIIKSLKASGVRKNLKTICRDSEIEANRRRESLQRLKTGTMVKEAQKM